MSKITRSDLVAPSDRIHTAAQSSRQKFQFFERRSAASQFRRAYSRNSTRSNKDHIPSLTLDEAVIEKFENSQHPMSKSVRRITEKKSVLETPRSINNFIFFSSSNAELIAKATVIQRNWRISIYKKKLRRFLDFVLKIRRRRLSYAFSMWILTTMPNQELAKKAYANIYKVLRVYLFLKKKKRTLILKNSKMKLLTFDEYMKTNILFSRYPSQVIVKYQQNFNKSLIQRLFQAWFSVASESLILSKLNRNVLIFAKYRENFGPQFWTYHVWKRWVYYKKQRKIELVETVSSNIYVPEWTFFRARKLTEARMRRDATRHYKIRLGKKIIQLLRDEMHRHNTLQTAYESMVSYSNQLSQLFGFRAFKYMIIFKRLREGILMRVLRSWYTVIDNRILNRAKIAIFTERTKLKLLKDTFKSWRRNIIKESIKIAFLHEQASQNLSSLLPIVFLMRNNFVHYTYLKCFANWKKMIDKKKNVKRFVYWSIKLKKKQTLIRFIFDIFKDNAKLPFKKSNYMPFNSNPEQGVFSQNSSQKCIMCPTTSVPEIIKAHVNVTDYQMYQGDWSKYASSEQIRTLFYRLVCLLSYKNKVTPYEMQARRIAKIKEFITKKQLYNLHQVNTIHQMNQRKDVEMKKAIQAMLKRDIHLITAYDAHSAALELSTQVPQFSVNDDISLFQTSPKTFSQEEEDVKENTKEEEEEDTNDDSIDTYSISSNSTQGSIFGRRRRNKVVRHSTPSIPFLRPINEVKESLMKMTSKFRRRPNDAFPLRSIVNRKPRQSMDLNSLRLSACSSVYGSFYEHFVQVQPDQSMIDLMKNKNFSLKELAGLKNQFADTEIELEPILEVENIFEEDLNDYYEYEEVEEEENKEGLESSITDLEGKTGENNEDKKKKKKSTDDFTKIRIGLHISKEKEPKKVIDEEYEDQNSSEKSSERLINGNTSNVDEIEQSLDNQMNEIDEIEKHFLDDADYFKFDQSERLNLLSNQYADVIHLLLGTSARPHANRSRVRFDANSQEESLKTNVTSLLKRISTKIKEDTILSRNRSISNYKFKETKKKRVKLFQDPDQQFQEETHTDGNTYQRSKCPEFAEVLFSGQKVLSNTPWQTDGSPEKDISVKPLTPAPSLPSAENVVPGFEDIEQDTENVVPEGPSASSSSSSKKESTTLNKIKRRASLFVQQNKEVKKKIEEILNDETIEDAMKIRILEVIDKIATKYLSDEALNKIKKGELTSFVEVDPEAPSSEEIFEESPIIQLKKKTKVRQFDDERKFAAFDTESREKPPMNSFDGRRRAFYKDLALAVLECGRFMTTKVIKETKDIRNDTSEYENLKFIRSVQQKQLAESRRKAEMHSKKMISLDISGQDYEQPVFTKAGVQKWAPPHKIQPTVYYSARSQNRFNSSGIKMNKSLPPTAISSSVSSVSNESSVLNNTSCSSTSSTVTISGTIDDSSVQVPLIEITKFDVNLPPPSSQPYRSISRSYRQNQRPKTQQTQVVSRMTFLKKAQSQKMPIEEEKPNVKNDFSVTSLPSFGARIFDDENKKKNKKKKKIISKKITTINEIPIPIPDPDPMQMSQSTRSLKRKPKITKYDPLVPEPQVEFEFKPKTSRSLNKNKNKGYALNKPLRPKWRPPNDKQIIQKDDVNYFVFVTPYVDQEGKNEDKSVDQDKQ